MSTEVQADISVTGEVFHHQVERQNVVQGVQRKNTECELTVYIYPLTNPAAQTEDERSP